MHEHRILVGAIDRVCGQVVAKRLRGFPSGD
jgi:hypothetical protein